MKLFDQPTIFDKAALEVGHITFDWASLEALVGAFITHLMGLDEQSRTADILNGNLDMRSKIHTAKGLAFLYHFDEDWLNTTLTLLDHINNNLRPRRNDITHSRWVSPSGRMKRVTHKTKILRPQSFSLELETKQIIPVKLKDLKLLRSDIQQTWANFLPVFFYTCDGDALLDPSSGPFLSFKKYVRLAGLGNPLSNVNSVRKRQQNRNTPSKRRSKARPEAPPIT